MEENTVLTGDSAFNAHFGEAIAAIGDIDDDGYQGLSKGFINPPFHPAKSNTMGRELVLSVTTQSL